jgi:DnaJ-class molecular chaperone
MKEAWCAKCGGYGEVSRVISAPDEPFAYEIAPCWECTGNGFVNANRAAPVPTYNRSDVMARVYRAIEDFEKRFRTKERK